MAEPRKKVTKLTVSEKRAHTAQHQDKKEKNRHAEQNRKIRVDEKKLDIMEANNQLKLEQQDKQWQAEQERKNQLDEERRERQAEQDKKQARSNEVDANKKILNAGAGVAKAVTPDDSKSSFKVGSLDISWGMFFLFALVFLFLTVSSAPGHSGESRLMVIWKAFTGKENIS